jgi:gliding motility-associated-like protein
VFTPNGDGINDRFVLNFPATYKVEVVFFDRWGIKLHTITTHNGFWDGQDAPDGAYYYIAKITDTVTQKETIRNGTVSIIR